MWFSVVVYSYIGYITSVVQQQLNSNKTEKNKTKKHEK